MTVQYANGNDAILQDELVLLFLIGIIGRGSHSGALALLVGRVEMGISKEVTVKVAIIVPHLDLPGSKRVDS